MATIGHQVEHVLVIGGGIIGCGIARALSLRGHAVTLVDPRAIGQGAFAVAADVGDPASVKQLFATVVKQSGKLDVLVNCAAIVPFVKWDELDFDEWRRVHRVNLDGLFLMCKAGSDLMRKNGYGRIVNICSNSIFASSICVLALRICSIASFSRCQRAVSAFPSSRRLANSSSNSSRR